MSLSDEDEFVPSFLMSKRSFREDSVSEEAISPLESRKYVVEEVAEPVIVSEESHPFVCGADGCEEMFTSEERYQSHYEQCHMRVCSVCGRSFYTYRFLNLHVMERHDAYFKLLCAKQPMYECLVGTCHRRFQSVEERHNHLLQFHEIPPDSALLKALDGTERSSAKQLELSP